MYVQLEILLGTQFVMAPRMVPAKVGRDLTSIVKVLMTEEIISGVLAKRRHYRYDLLEMIRGWKIQ